MGDLLLIRQSPQQLEKLAASAAPAGVPSNPALQNHLPRPFR